MATQCPKCDLDNPTDSKFCKECGTQLTPSELVLDVTKTFETPIQGLTKGTVFASRYEIIEKLGEGGMGEVYRVRDAKLDEEMALKVLRPEITAYKGTIERFKNELKLARKIAHRNVCKMYDLNEEGDSPFITMEYVQGEDLKQLIRREEKLSEKEAIKIAKQVCEGLSEAHRLRVVHRDLKPSNIMIDEQGNAKVMDFGIARSVEAAGVTQTGVIIGTPDYISPEQAEGEEADQRSDIYSLGVILYEMVTGQLPFKGETVFSVALKHKSKIPQDPRKLNPDISEDLSRLILVCMEKNRERRYETVELLLADLVNVEEGLPLGTKIKPRRETFIATLIRKKLIIPAVVCALAIAVVIIWQLLPEKDVVSVSSDRPFLAVIYFENNTGDEDLDHWRKALAELLIADISQSKHIEVLSGDRLFNLLRQLNLLEAESYSSEDLQKIADQGGANHILRGNYTKAGDSFRINVMVQNASTSDLIGSEGVDGEGEKSFFSMVDELTRRIKTHFKLSDEQISADLDKEVGKITTSSPEALNYYIEGIQIFLREDIRKSLHFFEKAVEIDPEFALAYRIIAVVHMNLDNYAESNKYAQKAMELTDRVSERERYIIQGYFNFTSEKTYDKAIEAYKNLLEIYPKDLSGNSLLAQTYLRLEDWDKAIELYRFNYETAIKTKRENPISIGNLSRVYMANGLYDKATEVLEKYLSQLEETPIVLSHLALSYLCQGKYSLAQSTIEKAISLSPRRTMSLYTYCDIFHLKGDLEKAEEEYQKLIDAEEKQIQFEGRIKLSAFYLLKGKFEKAKEQAKKGIELEGTEAYFHKQLAYTYLASGNPVDALKELEKSWQKDIRDESFPLSTQRWTLFLKGLANIKLDLIDEAQNTVDELKKSIEDGLYRKHWRYYYHLLGMIKLNKDNLSDAIDNFNKALTYVSSQHHNHNFFEAQALFMEPLALAYYKGGDIDKALPEYEKITKLTTGRLYYGDIYAKSYYMLGKIYEQKDYKGKAIENYEKFLDLWKDADLGIAEVDDAKTRLAKLESQ